MDVQLLVDAADVEPDRVEADVQLGGRRFVIMALHQQPQQPCLVRRQLTVRVGGRKSRNSIEACKAPKQSSVYQAELFLSGLDRLARPRGRAAAT